MVGIQIGNGTHCFLVLQTSFRVCFPVVTLGHAGVGVDVGGFGVVRAVDVCW